MKFELLVKLRKKWKGEELLIVSRRAPYKASVDLENFYFIGLDFPRKSEH